MLRYFLNDFEMVAVAPVIAGITFVFTLHMNCIYIVTMMIIIIVVGFGGGGGSSSSSSSSCCFAVFVAAVA